MTEDEAKTKWCPFARSLVVMREKGTETILSSVTANRWTGNVAHTPSPETQPRCLGSDCMAWRWEVNHDGTFNMMLSGPTLEVEERVPNFVQSATEGFCGLAGAPQ